MYANIYLQLADNGVATLSLNRPSSSNAFDAKTIEEMISALEETANNDRVRVLLVSSSGKHFSAGADIQWMKSMAHMSEQENLADAARLALLMRLLHQFPKPTIAQVQGAAFGGATGLIACCDIALATEDSRYCFSEVKIGLIPAVISPYVIRAIGARNASRLFLTAEVFDAAAARQYGLVHAVYSTTDIHQETEILINQLLKNGPCALTRAKQLIDRVAGSRLDDSLVKYTVEAIAKTRVSAEGQEGLQAFLDKRQPAWME